MIKIKIAFDDDKYYKVSDSLFVKKAKFERIGQGEYCSKDSFDDRDFLSKAYDCTMELFRKSWFKLHTTYFKDWADGYESDLLEFYKDIDEWS